jgi:hypothetical protein
MCPNQALQSGIAAPAGVATSSQLHLLGKIAILYLLIKHCIIGKYNCIENYGSGQAAEERLRWGKV